MIKRIRSKENLVGLVLKEIKDYIAQSGLKPGDKLPSEAELTRQLGCGKSSVREALKSLEALGIIEILHGRGAIVSKFNFDVIFQNLSYDLQVNKHELQELFEIREAFEVYFLDRIVDKISSQNISRLEELVEKMETAAKKDESFFQEDFAFHRLLFKQLNNAAALKLMRVFWNSLARVSHMSIDSTTPIATAQSHKKILDAIKERDPVKAKETMKNHFLEIRQRLQDKKEKTYR